jgi:4-hydroxymandelate oxidase
MDPSFIGGNYKKGAPQMSTQPIVKAAGVKLTSGQTLALTLLRVAIGWPLLYQGFALLLRTGGNCADCPSSSTWISVSFFRWIAETSWAMKTVDTVNMWALTGLGLCLMLGYLTRFASLGGAALLMLYFVAHPSFATNAVPWGLPRSYLIIDPTIVEVIALAFLALAHPSSLYGLDRLLFKRRSARLPFRRSTADEKSLDPKVLLSRRDVLANLAGVPVLGALTAAVAGAYTGGHMPRNTFLEAATPDPGVGNLSAQSENIVSIRDYERLAPTKMSPPVFEFIAGGAGDDQTTYWNQAAYQRIVLHPKMGIDVLKIDTHVTLLGRVMPHPIFLSPASEHSMLNPEGEKATARGAGAAQALMIVSTFATEKVEDIAKAATGPLWHATYLFKDKARTKDYLQRAEASGYQAIVVPIDTPVIGARDREERTYRSNHPNPISFQTYPVNYYRYPTSWADIEWYRTQTKLPLAVKGILDPDDAERAIQLGLQAIIVSNHGGRNLDTTPPTIDVLPGIVDRVAGRIPVLVDGGIRRGTDVLKALAFGATAVGIGRPYLYGLAVKGPEGVTGVVNILRNELEMAMAGAGRTTIASLDRSVINGNLNFPNYTNPGRFWST